MSGLGQEMKAEDETKKRKREEEGANAGLDDIMDSMADFAQGADYFELEEKKANDRAKRLKVDSQLANRQTFFF